MWYIGYNNGNWKIKPSNSAQKISVITIAKQVSARHFWVFHSTKFVFRRLAKEGKKIGEFREKNARKVLYTHGTRHFVHLPWINPSLEQRLAIGEQAMCIAYNHTSVVVINFQKSKTHAITDTYCTCTLGIEEENLRRWSLVRESKRIATKGMRNVDFPYGLVVRIRRSHRRGPGSIPGVGTDFFFLHFFTLSRAWSWLLVSTKETGKFPLVDTIKSRKRGGGGGEVHQCQCLPPQEHPTSHPDVTEEWIHQIQK